MHAASSTSLSASDATATKLVKRTIRAADGAESLDEAALREVKGRFTSNVLVALGVDWALEMGAAAATAAVNENDDSFLSPALPPAVSPRASPRSHRRV